VGKLNCVSYFFEYFINAGPYKNKVVVLADMDNGNNGNDYQRIEQQIGDRFYKLDKSDLELYYPKSCLQYLTEEERKMIAAFENNPNYNKHSDDCNRNKCSIAEKIGENISKDIFKKDMSIIFKALQKCWSEQNVL
jgi:hypothetical protein